MYKFINKKGEVKKCFIFSEFYTPEGELGFIVLDDLNKKHKCIRNEEGKFVEITKRNK